MKIVSFLLGVWAGLRMRRGYKKNGETRGEVIQAVCEEKQNRTVYKYKVLAYMLFMCILFSNLYTLRMYYDLYRTRFETQAGRMRTLK